MEMRPCSGTYLENIIVQQPGSRAPPGQSCARRREEEEGDDARWASEGWAKLKSGNRNSPQSISVGGENQDNNDDTQITNHKQYAYTSRSKS